MESILTYKEVEELENKEINDVRLARDLESDVTISQTNFISSDKYDRHDRGVDLTIFEAEELKNNEMYHA